MPKTNELRIIGGQWRRRKLPFCSDKAIRPTPDRVRETVFNWLQHDIAGARCLDAFAGSGALGFEALSRGAQSVVMIEPLREQQHFLRDNASLLGAEAILLHGEFPQVLRRRSEIFDIIFLDPPFQKQAVEQALADLFECRVLREGSLVYYESGQAIDLAELSTRFAVIKTLQASSVHYGLLRLASLPGCD